MQHIELGAMHKERRLDAIAIVKKIAAVFLLAALFLPLSQCTVTKPIPGTHEVKQETITTYAYPSKEWLSVDAIAVYVAFLWPAIFVMTSFMWPALNKKAIVGVLELLLCFGSGYVLLLFTFGKSLLYGGYIAWVAIGTYCITTCIQVVIQARAAWRKRARPVTR